MPDEHVSLGVPGWAWRIALVAAAMFIGITVGGGLVTMLGLELPRLPVTPAPGLQLALGLLGAVLVAGCVAPLARHLRGSPAERWLAIGSFTYVCWGLNNAFESAFFTTLGGLSAMAVMFIGPAVLGGAAATLLVPVRPAVAEPEGQRLLERPFAAWWWRLVVVWLAFPVIYYFFGMLIYPLVRDVYQQPGSGLIVPDRSVVVHLALARSLLYLAVTLPLVMGWTASRAGLKVALGAAFFVMVGLTGLLGATWWPLHMRLAHLAETLGDSIVYAWVIVALLVPKRRSLEPGAALP